MTITYTWKISEIECIPAQGDLSNVVTNVHWRLDGTDGNNFSGVYGVTSLNAPTEGNFTAFEDLTEQQVTGWLETALGDNVAAYKTKIQEEINKLANPPVVTKTPPWMSAAPANT